MAAKRSKKRSTTKGAAARGAKGAAKAKKAKAVKAVKAKAAKARKAPAKRGKAAKPAKKVAARRPAPARKAAPPVKRPAAPAEVAAATTTAATVLAPSRFVWFDLMARDLGAAQSFYTSLMGWSTKDVDAPMPPANKYTMFTWNGEEFGGLMSVPSPDAPPSWLPYVSVENVDEISRRAAELGGKVLMPGMDIPNVGRFSVIADPTGGVVSPMSFVQPPRPPPAQGILGPVAWVELQTSEPEKAGVFYKELFGWGGSEMDMGPGGKYTVFKAGDRDAGGMGARAPFLPANCWLVYFMVDDVDTRTQAAVIAGATVVGQAMDIPNVGRMSYLRDPQGALFSLFKGAPSAPSA